MSSDGRGSDARVSVPKVLLERLQHEVERLRAERVASTADLVNREALRDRFVEASAALWSLVQTVRNKDRLDKRFLDASAALWALVQDQADEVDHARQYAARLAGGAPPEASAAVPYPPPVPTADDDDDGAEDELRAHLEGVLQRAVRLEEAQRVLTEERDALRVERDGLRVERDGLTEEVEHLRRTHPMPPRRPSASPENEPEPGDRSTEDIVATAFVAWCQRNRSLVSRPYLFAAFLQSAASGAEVEVRTVFRDREASPPVFRETLVGGVEHWLVRLGPTQVLVPQPLRPSEFRELSPVFNGQATPETLATLSPARVVVESGALRLDAPGRVSADGEKPSG